MKKEIIQLHERFKQEAIARPRLQNYSVYVSQVESHLIHPDARTKKKFKKLKVIP